MNDHDELPFDCRRARKAIHGILDGDALRPDDAQWLHKHLGQCRVCRGFEAEMQAIQGALHSLSAARLPDDALEEVWDRTTRAPGPQVQTRHWRLDWRSFAVAAVLTAAAFGLWQWNSRPDLPREPAQTVGLIVIDPERVRSDPEYARQIAAETRRVLGLTSDALRRTERAAFHGILAGEVGGTLERVPVTWPEQDQEQIERNRQRENEL